MNDTLQWFAVQAKPASEGIAESSLRSMQLETLLPSVKTRACRERRGRGLARKPLFPGYLFARFRPEQSLRAVTYSRGVTRVVGARQGPLPLDEAIIGSIRARMDSNGFVALERPALTAGDQVNISSGPFGGWPGVFERELSDGQRVMILLETLQRCRLIVSRDSVERVEKF
jgi:transcriptional antiterminator RfaH